MKHFLSPSKKDTLLVALMYFLFGIVLCFFSGRILTTIIRMLGLLACVFGSYEMYTYFTARQYSNDMTPIFVGIPSLILGLFLASNPQMLLNFFPILAGLFILVNSIAQIQKALVFKRAGVASWAIDLVVAFVMLGVSVFLIMRPGSVINMIMSITGYVLIFEAIILVFQALNKNNDVIDM